LRAHVRVPPTSSPGSPQGANPGQAERELGSSAASGEGVLHSHLCCNMPKDTTFTTMLYFIHYVVVKVLGAIPQPMLWCAHAAIYAARSIRDRSRINSDYRPKSLLSCEVHAYLSAAR